MTRARRTPRPTPARAAREHRRARAERARAARRAGRAGRGQPAARRRDRPSTACSARLFAGRRRRVSAGALPDPRGPRAPLHRGRDRVRAAGARRVPDPARGRSARATWLPRLAAGEAVAAFALTEPGAGSDVAALALRAEPDGDGFRLTGEKTYISNAPDADVYTVFARTTASAGARGITAFAVPGDAEGLPASAIELLAPHPIGRLRFDGVAVPARPRARRARPRLRASRWARSTCFRPSVGAFAVGMAQAALAAAVDHAGRAAGVRPAAARLPGRLAPARRRRHARAGRAPARLPAPRPPTTRASGP